jgi:hypothetical protein
VFQILRLLHQQWIVCKKQGKIEKQWIWCEMQGSITMVISIQKVHTGVSQGQRIHQLYNSSIVCYQARVQMIDVKLLHFLNHSLKNRSKMKRRKEVKTRNKRNKRLLRSLQLERTWDKKWSLCYL